MKLCSYFLLALSASSIVLASELPSATSMDQDTSGLSHELKSTLLRSQRVKKGESEIAQGMALRLLESVPEPFPIGLRKDRSLLKDLTGGGKGDKDKEDDKETEKTTTHTKTSTSSSSSTTSKATSTSVNFIATNKSPTTDKPSQSTNGAPVSSRASSAPQSSSACQATGKASKSKGYTVTAELKNYKTCLSIIEKHINKPENKCTNDIVLRDDDGSDSQYILVMADPDTVALIRKTKACKNIAEVKMSKNTKPPPSKSNSTMTDLLKDAKTHKDDADIQTRETWAGSMSRLFRRIRYTEKTRDSWALLRFSVGQVTRLNMATSQRKYVYPSTAGRGVDIYVIDDSLNDPPHPQISGRVKDYLQSDYVRAARVATEDHPLRVTGYATRATVGAAPKANLISVKVKPLNRQTLADYIRRYGEYEGEEMLNIASLISAFKKVRRRYETKGHPGVLAMAQSAPYDEPSIDAEIMRIDRAGMLVIHSAGNLGLDACLEEAENGLVNELGHLTVGATDINDEVSEFSNWGNCVDIYAPGESVIVPDTVEGFDLDTDEGTSFSTGYVAGIVALMLGEDPRLTPARIRSRISRRAGRARDRIRGGTVSLIQMTDLF